MIKRFCLPFVLAATFSTAAFAMDESAARTTADDFANAISAATGVIGGLQKVINSSSVAGADIETAAIIKAFHGKFEAKAGYAFDVGESGLVGEYRGALEAAIKEVMQENREDILAGGQDAFVPAFFRAQVLEKVNEVMAGKIAGYVTNNDDHLINGDSAVDVVMDGSPLAAEVAKLLSQSRAEKLQQVVSGHLMSYSPMKLKQSCVTCHARNGIEQQVGGFGGALVVDVKL